MSEKLTKRNPRLWVPTLYYAQGIPYVVVMLVSVIMYKRMGISNTDIAFYTSLLYLPWVLKPLWSPFVDMFKTKRFWIVVMQFIVGLGLAGVAFMIPLPGFLQYTLAFFFLLAISSATHDIAADGFYMLGLNKGDQAFYVGIRSLFYRLSMITGQGLIIILAGYFELNSGVPSKEIVVNVKPGLQTEQIVIGKDIQPVNTGDLQIVPVNKEVNLSAQKITRYFVDSVVFAVKKQNARNNLYGRESDDILKEEFTAAPEDKKTEAGNIGLISFYLSGRPSEGREVVVNIDRSGDKNLSLISGSRFVFNEYNWDQPAYAVVQVDPKLRNEASASFTLLAGDIPWAWSMTFLMLTGLFVLFFLYHTFILPYPTEDKAVRLTDESGGGLLRNFGETFVLFFKKPKMGLVITFLLIYRFGEAQLVKLASPFLLDPREVGGIGLTTSEVGIVYGTVGIIALSIGGILGGILASRHGLKKWLWWMFAAINIPHILYIYLAYAQPDNFIIINLCVAGEQFGYGFGFTAYMLYMIYVSEGEFKTSHYAIATGFMALSMMIPGLFAGAIQEYLGYKLFFVWILFTMVPGFFITKMLPLDPLFGKKTEIEEKK